MKSHYSMGAGTLPSRSPEQRRVQSIVLNNHYVESHSRCGGLRADGPNSDVTVFDAATMKIKRYENPNGMTIKRCRN